MMPVEGCCPLILRLDDQSIGRNFRAASTLQCIPEQRAAKTLPLETLIHRQTAHARGRHAGYRGSFFAVAGGRSANSRLADLRV